MSRILIVEDNADLLEILRELLSVEHEVAVARGGEEGIELTRSFAPEVVILDRQLPVMDGLEAGRSIKEASSPPDVPILMLTALTGSGDPEDILSTGCCDAYMSKPASLDAIRTKVQELLEGRPETA